MRFCTSIHCMDGRIQEPLIRYLKAKTKCRYVDAITEPGPARILAEQTDTAAIVSIKKRIEVSLHHHGSRVLAVSGHHDCVGNPVPKDVQIEQLARCEEFLRGQYPEARIIKLWVGSTWEVEEC